MRRLILAAGLALISGAAVAQPAPPPQPILTASVTLSSAQVLAINVTPITVVPAPASTQVINFVSQTVVIKFNTAAYSAVALTTKYAAGGDLGIPTPATLLSTASDAFYQKTGDTLQTSYASSLTRGSALQISAASAPITGDSPITFTIYYTLVPG